MESLDQCRRLEVREKARNVFVMSQYVCMFHNIASSSSFFTISLGFSRFFRSYFVLQIFGVKEFNKTIIPFALVGYETGNRQLDATRLVGYLPSHIQRALME